MSSRAESLAHAIRAAPRSTAGSPWRPRSAGCIRHDGTLKNPYEPTLAAHLAEPSFQALVGRTLAVKARFVKDTGNAAAHGKPVSAGAGGDQPARILPRRLLARTHLCEGAETGGGRGFPRRGAAASRPGAGDDAGAIAGDRPPLRRDGEGARGGGSRAPRERGRPRGARSRNQGAAGRDRRRQGGEPGRSRPPRLQRSGDPRPLHRPPAARGRLRSQGARHRRGRGHRHAERARRGLRRLRAARRRRQAARAGRSQAHAQGPARRPAAGQALCRLPGGAIRPAADHLLLQRLRPLDLGRHPASAAADPGLPQEGRAGAADPAPRDAQAAGAGGHRSRHRRALLSAPRHPPGGGSVRARQAAQGARRHGDRRRQDPHGHRARRPDDAGELGASACCSSPTARRWCGRRRTPSRSIFPASPPVNLLEDKHAGGPGLRLDLSDHDGPDRRGGRGGSGGSASVISTSW